MDSPSIHKNGCLDLILSHMKELALVLGGVGIGIAFVQVSFKLTNLQIPLRVIFSLRSGFCLWPKLFRFKVKNAAIASTVICVPNSATFLNNLVKTGIQAKMFLQTFWTFLFDKITVQLFPLPGLTKILSWLVTNNTPTITKYL